MPPKNSCRAILDDLLAQKSDHPEVGPYIVELRKHVSEREADKQFYLSLIRHFAKDHEIFRPEYCPPIRPKSRCRIPPRTPPAVAAVKAQGSPPGADEF